MQKRADIQSLRALAILAVLMGHAHFARGGYVGVDVFFVLSGYLITGLILIEVESTAKFRPFAFYARRLKRLLPALVVVLFSTWAFASVIVVQNQPSDAQAGELASFWVSNFYFFARAINYFAAKSSSNLFLQTWSLGVEEQFYIIWPFLILLFYGHFRRQRNERQLTYALIMVAIVSMALNLYLVRVNPKADFYLMPGRAWEFAIGALVFLGRRNGRFRRSHFTLYGYSLILISTFVFPTDLAYPGFWALVPCVGAALVLADESCPRFLLVRPLQFTGDISYSLYLWHWPLLLVGIWAFGHSILVRLALVALSVGLAAITYFAVEDPIRRLNVTSYRVFVPSLGIVVFGFLMLNNWYWNAEAMLRDRVHDEIFEAEHFDTAPFWKLGCDTEFNSAKIRACVVGHGKRTIGLVGDSVSALWFPTLREIYPNSRLVVLNKSGCPASTINYFSKEIKAPYTVCKKWRRRAISYLAKLDPSILFMGSGRYPAYHFSDARWIKGTRETLKRLAPHIKHIVLMNPVPVLPFNAGHCLWMRADRPKWLPRRKCTYHLPSKDHMFAVLKQAARTYPNVFVANFDNIVCANHICRAKVKGKIAYQDNEHLTASFTKSLAPQMTVTLKALFKSRRVALKW